MRSDTGFIQTVKIINMGLNKMLYDLNFLGEGKIFPPYTELERLEMYRQNKLLFEHRLQEVFSSYLERIRQIINKFNDTDWAQISPDIYSLDMDYFELLSIKTADLTVGDPPTITVKKRHASQEEIENGGEDELNARHQAAEKNLKAIEDDTHLINKLNPLVIDISRYGDAVVRIFEQTKDRKNNFTGISPEMWFPVVDKEIKENRLYDVLAWIECCDLDEKDETRRKYILKVQIHSVGQFEKREYIAEKYDKSYTLPDNSNCTIQRYKIGKMISKSQPIKTGLSASAIRDFHNVTTADTIFGINDYDRINAIIAELGVRYTLEALVLDKHTAPTLAADETNFFQNIDGTWTANVGGVMKVKNGQPFPQYIVWDASLQANHTMIEKLEKHLYSLSEMGAVLNDDSFGASQGFEALETRMTNARTKARRLGSLMVTPLKELISLLSEKGYEKIETEDISVQFNDGLPLTENQEVNIALKKVGGGALEDVSTVLQEHFGKSKEEADAIAEILKQNAANPFSGNFLNIPTDEEPTDTEPMPSSDDGGDVTDEEG